MGKVVNVTENERKFLVKAFIKESLWDREFIIYQWYDKTENERKTKFIIDIVALTAKWVRVTKNRVSNSESKKKVEYLDPGEVDLDSLVGEPFICKRRYLSGKISIDRFVRSNGNCKYLLEDEGDGDDLNNLVHLHNILLEDVTDDMSFRNTNMTIAFTEEDKSHLLFLIDVLNIK